ncbi:GST-like protein YliJ [Enterobacter hormaechei subsp. xiangfangensis]|nr:GST-like protein YliJ [Enterobacter hormaechei subsp. xiangfangensis]
MDWANQTLSPRRGPDGLSPAIHAAQDACESLFAMMDDELAKHTWFSGDTFGVGDIAVAPFVCLLTWAQLAATW